MKYLLILLVFAISCSRVSEKVEDKLDSGAEKVGKTATDLVNSIDKGIMKGSAISIAISDDLKKNGLSSGKYYISDKGGSENMISIYLISDNNIDRTLKLKLFDKNGLEMGRLQKNIKQQAGQAGYHDFIFDARVSFEDKSKLVIE